MNLPGALARADLYILAAQGRQDAIEALLRQFRPVILRFVRARLARRGNQDEDDVAQDVCLALLSALPSYRDRGRPFAVFVFAIAAHKVADAARSPLPVPSCLICLTCPIGTRYQGPATRDPGRSWSRASRPARCGSCWRTCMTARAGFSCSGWWAPRTPGTSSACRPARSASPSTGPKLRLRARRRMGDNGARPSQPLIGWVDSRCHSR